MKYFGVIGNNIFLIASCWFLVDNDLISKKKTLKLEGYVFFTSIVILLLAIALKVSLSNDILVSSIFPTLMGSNWFVSCYFLLYGIHPFLNRILIENNGCRNLCVVLFLLYIVIPTFYANILYTSKIVVWISIYLCIGYLKYNHIKLLNSIKHNKALFLLSLFGVISMVVGTYIIGLTYPRFSDILRWDKDCNVFVVLLALSLFNIVRNVVFRSTIINYLSSLTILIYVIHENIIVRNYLRPFILQRLCKTEIYNNIAVCVISNAILTFILSVTIGCIIKVVVDVMSNKLEKKYATKLEQL